MNKYLFLTISFFFGISSFGQNTSFVLQNSDSTNTKIAALLKNLPQNTSKQDLDYLLFKFGYFDYDSYLNKKDSTTTIINLGRQTPSIVLTFNNPDSLALKSNYQELNKSIKTALLEQHLKDIKNDYIENGYPFTEVFLTDIKKTANIISATLNIRLNDKEERVLSRINIKGYENFPKSYVKHYLNLKPNQSIQLNDLKKKSNILRELQFAEEIKPSELLFTKETTELFLYLKKKSVNNFDGIIGFNTNENTNKLEFNGFLNLNLINNLNYGEELNLRYKSDGNKQRNLNVKLKLPYLFQTKIGAEIQLNIFTRDSLFTNSTLNLKSIYNINNKLKTTIGYQSSSSTTLELNNNSTQEDYNSEYITGGINFDSNKTINQTQLNIEAKTGQRKTAQETTSQNIFLLYLRQQIKTNKKSYIELRNTTGLIDSKNILTNELFRFGGINSLRGFNENTIEADKYTVVNLEYHYTLSKGLSINSITDFGYLKNSSINLTEKLYALGIGIQTKTKAGLLTLNFANGVLEGENPQFKNTKLHVSLNARF